jgi:bifunctional DNase/RNase
MWHSGRELVLDSRPSDAIALALRTETPIYMSEKVARDTLAIKDLLSEEQQQELKELLESNRPNETKKSLH